MTTRPFRVMIGASRNEYRILNGNEWVFLEDQRNSDRFGVDYYARVLRSIEENGKLEGFTFYLSKDAPESLPCYGSKVVLIINGDEHYRCFRYFKDILAVVRCYGDRPCYVSGLPYTSLNLTALMLYLYKFSEYLRDLWRSTKFNAALVRRLHRQTLHVPLGCFGRFEPELLDFSERSFDYAFLGSIDHRKLPWYSPLRLFKQPKSVSRTEMMTELSRLSKERGCWRGRLDVTTGFAEAADLAESYAQAMSNCKISICPRGTNPETYRVYESMKAGCVVISEPIPQSWFHDGFPGIVIKRWRDLPDLLDKLLKDAATLERLGAASRDFWTSHLSERVVAAKIEAFILGLTREAMQ